MADTEENFFLEAVAQGESDMLHRVIGNTFIIEYGIIKDVPADGIVTVEMSVAEKNTDVIITNCVLASFASSSFSVNIKPNVDDKVMVLFPRKFHNDMFKKDKNETIIYEQGTGYNVLTGIAVLLNQYQEDTHKNYIDISDGEVTAKLAYSEDEDKNLVEFTSDKDGNIELKNDKADIKVSSEGEITVDNSKATITVDTSGNVKIDAQGGKISLKNNITSLFDIIDGMLQILNTSLATAGSPASHTVVPQQFAEQSTLLGQLME